MEIKGAQFGIILQKHSSTDPAIYFQLLGEDDENWFEIGEPFPSDWLSDLIEVHQQVQITLSDSRRFEGDRNGFGYQYKTRSSVHRTPTISGQNFAVSLHPRGDKDPHVSLQLPRKVDQDWIEIGNGSSSFWLPDLLAVLGQTETVLHHSPSYEQIPSNDSYRPKSLD